MRQLYHWYTSETVTMHQVAQRLNTQASPSPTGGRWSYATVLRLLERPAYTGITSTNRHQTDDSQVGQLRKQGHRCLQFPRYQQRSTEEWISCAVPPIIDTMLWEQAQQTRQRNAQHAKRNARRTYLLRSLLV